MPLLFDMPYDQLATYAGTNPCPSDFDAYWDAALQDVQSRDPCVEIIETDDFNVSGVTCSHLWFTGVGSARIHARLLRPERAGAPTPAVLMFHGYSGSCGDWMGKLGYALAGFTVAAMDCRGQGGLSEDCGGVKGTTLNGHIIRGLDDAPEKLLYRQIFLDTVQLARVIMSFPSVDETRVGVKGGSQGGGLALACAALEPRIKKAAVKFPFLSDYLRTWTIDQAKDAYAELREFFRRHDPQHKRETEIFTRLGYIDIQNLAPRIQAEVLMATGLSDTICPPSTQFAAYNKINSSKQLEVYPDFGHEFLPGFRDRVFRFLQEL
ncbi:MAG: acetylxylan esterase [Kiritimatiellales bacterium]